ncbi:MAG: heme-binding domain-containing protein [Bryobacteraceae bacterium]
MIRKILLVSLALIVIVSLLTRPRASEGAGLPLLEGAHIPAEVRAAFERSCRDCHSESTRFPWYSYIAPISWLVKNDVTQGREHLNLSRWNEYSLIRRERCLSEIANQIQDGGMPLASYTWIHRDAVLSPADIDAIFQWTQEERTRLIAESVK